VIETVKHLGRKTTNVFNSFFIALFICITVCITRAGFWQKVFNAFADMPAFCFIGNMQKRIFSREI
jgi:hypothetical protein